MTVEPKSESESELLACLTQISDAFRFRFSDTKTVETGQQHASPETAKPATNGATKARVGKCVNNTTINH
jgi:hypothetical protein